MTSHGALLRRVLQYEREDGGGEFNPNVFWGVNTFLLLVLFAVCFYCVRFQEGALGWNVGAAEASDETFRRTVLERRAAEEERKQEAPEQRIRSLEKSFQRTTTVMVVKEADILSELSSPCYFKEATEPSSTSDENSTTSQSDQGGFIDDESEDTGEDVETGIPIVGKDEHAVVEKCEDGYLMLPCKRQVANCCAVCLCPYEIAEEVVWSRSCPHAFHKECMLNWLIKQREGTPCPCCRQDFTDLKKHKLEKRITWDAANSFNPSTVRFL